MRVFFAIELPEDLQQAVAGFARTLRGDLRRVHAEQIHLTLRFVGEIADERLPELIGTAREALNGPPFTLCLDGGGAFGARARPRVLWLGTGGEIRRVKAVARTLEQAVRELGLPPCDRPFSPHVTVARVQGRLPPATLERVRFDGPSGLLPVQEITLFRSELGPGGARHSAIHRFALGEEAAEARPARVGRG